MFLMDKCLHLKHCEGWAKAILSVDGSEIPNNHLGWFKTLGGAGFCPSTVSIQDFGPIKSWRVEEQRYVSCGYILPEVVSS